jgi:hypothetical protein
MHRTARFNATDFLERIIAMYRSATLRLAALALVCFASASVRADTVNHALRFFGTGTDDIDRVKIPLVDADGRSLPVNVAGDFTLELFLKAELADNSGHAAAQPDGWITGNIVVDRDVYHAGDHGDWGLSLGGGRVAFGAAVGEDGATIVGRTIVADGRWRHIAVTRHAETGRIAIYVDGRLDAAGDGPPGRIDYRAGRDTEFPASDPYLVIGAEKHDAGWEYPSFTGLIDELRLSGVIRYTENFTPPAEPFAPDEHTRLLLHFDEGEGEIASDASGHGNHGQVGIGGPHDAPRWTDDTPFVQP